ncbi:MAG TPA: hypothetical protein VK922_03795 [Gemmatimonadaceae bacterium]|nr:hypothetical protein [Gemmatimonadaceae bacterium]
MTTQIATDGDAVTTLFAERQRFEGWLTALEARRANTPLHIYERVKSDYEGRLRGVMEQLRAQRATVEARASSLSNRIGELDVEARKHEDERAEIELRASIGEIDDEQCEATRRAANQRLSGINSEREQLSAELAHLREILLASADAPKPAPHAPPAAAAAPAPPSNAPQPGDQATAEQPAAFDELEFLKSVTDSRGTRSGIATADTGTAVETDRRTSPSRPTPARNGQTSGSVPVFLRDVPAEQTKTLKCQECGTMNYPTEWYCERCGAELAAL